MAVTEQHFNPAAEVGSRRTITATLASNVNALLPIVASAPAGRCEYLSTTHGSWMQAKIVASDKKTGAIQIDKKPGVWISPDEQKARIRVTQASIERAAKDAKASNARATRGSADSSQAREPSILFPAPVAVQSDDAAPDLRSEAVPSRPYTAMVAPSLNGDSNLENGSEKSLGLRARGSPSGRCDAELLVGSLSAHAYEFGGSTASSSAPQGARVTTAPPRSYITPSTVRASLLSGGQDAIEEFETELLTATQRDSVNRLQYPVQRPTVKAPPGRSGAQAATEDPLLARYQEPAMPLSRERVMSVSSAKQAFSEDQLAVPYPLRGALSTGLSVNEEPVSEQKTQHLYAARPDPAMRVSTAPGATNPVRGKPLSGDFRTGQPVSGNSCVAQALNEEPLIVQPHQQTTSVYPEPGMASSTARAATPLRGRQPVSENLRTAYPEPLVGQPRQQTTAAYPDPAMASSSARPPTPSRRGQPVSENVRTASPVLGKWLTGQVANEEPLIAQPGLPTATTASAVTSFQRGQLVTEDQKTWSRQISTESATSDATLPAPHLNYAVHSLPDPPICPRSDASSATLTRQMMAGSAFSEEPVRTCPQNSAVSRASQQPPVEDPAKQLPPKPDPPSSAARQLSGASSSVAQMSGKSPRAGHLSEASAVSSTDEEPPRGHLGHRGQPGHIRSAVPSPLDQASPSAFTENAAREDPHPQRPSGHTVDGNESQDAGAAGSTASVAAAAPSPESSTSKSTAASPLEDVIALDEYGRPLIMRQIHPETGSARTLVMNEDGSQRIFGEHTCASLTASNEEEAKAWILSLSGTQLRGLVHEVGQRLLEGSRLYHARLGQLEKMGEHLNYVYFGLTADSSDKELDQAYRSLAKRMHPDKNGGTEEAKRRFQHMKERYELLKKRRGMMTEDDDENDMDLAPQSSGGEEDADEDGAKRIKDKKPPKNGEEEEEATVGDKKGGEDNSGNIEYDPGDKNSMLKTVTKMLGQLKNVEVQMKVVVKELKRIQSEVTRLGNMPCK